MCVLSPVQRFATPWAAAHQAPLSLGLSRPETGAGCHFLLQGIFLTESSNPGLLQLLNWQADSLPLSHQGSPLGVTVATSSIPKNAEGWRATDHTHPNSVNI